MKHFHFVCILAAIIHAGAMMGEFEMPTLEESAQTALDLAEAVEAALGERRPK